MTKDQYQKAYSSELKTFIESPCGQATLGMLTMLRPPLERSDKEHLLLDSYSSIRGYETCLRAMISLTIPPPPSPEVQADYGVPEITKE